MMDDDECKHGMNPDWCSACKEGPKRPERWEPTGVKIEARFSSSCPACHLLIEAGDTLIQQSNASQLIPETRFVCRSHEGD